MARIRSIKPEFWVSEQIVDCSRSARLLFIGLWCFVDDYGVGPSSMRWIRARVFPADDDLPHAEVERLYQELVSAGLLREFEAYERLPEPDAAGDFCGKLVGKYFAVTGWHHQKIERRTRKYPPPPAGDKFDDHQSIIRRWLDDNSTIIRRAFDERSTSVRRSRTLGEERRGEDRRGVDTSCTELPQSGTAVQEAELTDFVFSCSGPSKTWTLPARVYQVLREAYPGVDLDCELRKARGWCETAGAKRKTARGMERFLNSWMTRAQDRATGTGGIQTSRPRQPVPAAERASDLYQEAKELFG